MQSGRLEPARFLPVTLAAIGAVALAAITLPAHSATRMYAAPWHVFYWIALLAPAAVLALQFAFRREFFLPARNWTFLGLATVAVVLLSACLSPYRAQALLWSAPALSAMACFFVVHDFLRRNPESATRFESVAALVAGIVIAANIAWWLRDVATLVNEGRLRASFFDQRNPHPLGHSNYTAGLALLALPWLALAARRHRGGVRLISIAGTALALVALFTSGSRGGLLGLGALAVAALLVSGIGRKRLLFLSLAAIVGVAVLAFANPRIRAMLRAPDPTMAPNASSVQRAAMLDAGWEMGAERPLLGWGLHTTPLVYPLFRARLDGGAENVLQLHSTPLEIWAGLGGAGLALLAAAIAQVASNARGSPVAAATLAGYGVMSLTDYQLDVPVFALAVAALAAKVASTGSASRSTTGRRPLALLAIAVPITTIALLGRRDSTPTRNAEALELAQTPAGRAGAIAKLRESLELNPDQEIAHFNLGWLLVVSEPAAAEKHFRRAAQLVPDKGGVYFGIGLARLNLGDRDGAARLLALECVNDPRFIASPWWREAGIAELRDAARTQFERLLTRVQSELPSDGWTARQAAVLATLAPRFGEVPRGPEKAYRRQRTGYTVLTRNHDIAAPVDVYDVRESTGLEASLSYPLPPKGWLPTPLLVKLLDEAPTRLQ